MPPNLCRNISTQSLKTVTRSLSIVECAPACFPRTISPQDSLQKSAREWFSQKRHYSAAAAAAPAPAPEETFENNAGHRTETLSKRQVSNFEELDRAREGRERVVILGSGWGGYNLARALDPKKFQTILVSPRSYFVFTPLLASTSVGTLEFRTALEPIRSSRRNSHHYIQAWADDVDFFNKTITLEEAVNDERQGLAMTGSRFEGKTDNEVFADAARRWRENRLFELKYDKLVVAVGCYSQTFNTPGVRTNANFLKDVGDARRIRKKILSCFETAALPTTPVDIRKQLLNFAIVGGGPTGFEFAAELHDLIRDDLHRLYPHLKGLARITLHDVAPSVLPMFDQTLRQYATDHFSRERISVKTKSRVESLEPGLPAPPHADPSAWADLQKGRPGLTLRIKDCEPEGVGMVVWSTGLMPNPFITKALAAARAFPSRSAIFKADRNDAEHARWHIRTCGRTGSIITNDRLRVILEAPKPGADATDKQMRAFMSDVFALGDCGSIQDTAYPATAQVADQKATWLAKHLNRGDLGHTRFQYRDLGVMAYVGGWRAIFQGAGGSGNVSGRAAWVLWRAAYMVKSVSWRNRVLIPIFWVINGIFGRDISRF